MTLYIAYDDTEFTDESECRAYEEEARGHVNELMDTYTFYDKNNCVIIPDCDEVGEYLQWFYSTIDDCEYIAVHKDLSREAHKFLYQGINIYVPEEKGFYKYDWNKNEWVSAN